MSLVIIPDTVPPLCIVLALLVTWREYKRRLEAGAITAKDLFNPSGIRLYVYVTPNDPEMCDSCRQAHGNAFLAGTVEQKGFAPLASPCTSPEKCLSVLIPLSGRWLEANEVIARLRSSRKNPSVPLTAEELLKLASVVQHLDAGDRDRPGLHLLSAFMQERNNPRQAIQSYGAVLDEATHLHEPLLVPAYMRLAGLLARRGDPRKALQVIAHFEKRYARADVGTFQPTGKQRRALSTMKSYLYSIAESSTEHASKPATIQKEGMSYGHDSGYRRSSTNS